MKDTINKQRIQKDLSSKVKVLRSDKMACQVQFIEIYL